MNEINLKIETKIIESKSIETRFKWGLGEPIFGISYSAYKSLFVIYKNSNFVRRLNNRKL